MQTEYFVNSQAKQDFFEQKIRGYGLRPQTMQHFYVSDFFSPRKMLSTDLDFCLVLLLYVFLLADLEQFLLILRLLLMVSTLIKLGIAYFRTPLLDTPPLDALMPPESRCDVLPSLGSAYLSLVLADPHKIPLPRLSQDFPRPLAARAAPRLQ